MQNYPNHSFKAVSGKLVNGILRDTTLLNQKLVCFVCYLKIINIAFFDNY